MRTFCAALATSQTDCRAVVQARYQLAEDESLESSDDLPDPQDLATEAITELESIVDDLREIVALIEGRKRESKHESFGNIVIRQEMLAISFGEELHVDDHAYEKP